MPEVPPEESGSPTEPLPEEAPASSSLPAASNQPPADAALSPPDTAPAFDAELPAEPWLDAASPGLAAQRGTGARFSTPGWPPAFGGTGPLSGGEPPSAGVAAPPYGGPPIEAAPPAERARPRRGVGRLLRELAETVILALLIFLLVRAAVQNFQVEGSSMEPSLHDGLYLLVNKALYFEVNLETVHKFLPFIDPGDDPTRYVLRRPRRGDVIVFRAPDQQPGSPERDFIKRIIGEPGETVEVRNGTVFIDGKPLEEPYIQEPGGQDFGPETVPPGHYFVLGDNRSNSFDSRSFGMLPRENIIGQAWFSYWKSCNSRWLGWLRWCPAFGLVDNTTVEPGSGVPADQPREPAEAKQPVGVAP